MAGLPVLRHLMYVEGMHRTEGFPFTTVTADTTLVAVGMPASGVDAYSNSDPAPAFQAGTREIGTSPNRFDHGHPGLIPSVPKQESPRKVATPPG